MIANKITNLLRISILFCILFGTLFISSCSWFHSKPISIQVKETPKPQLNISYPEPLTLKKVTWFVITPETSQEVFAKLKNNKTSIVLFGLTDDGYQNLSINLAKIRKYLVEQHAVIKEYKLYYEHPEKVQKVQNTQNAQNAQNGETNDKF